jgi:hypothetical protein
MDQINEAYEFFNEILKTHQNEILFVPTVATVVPPGITTMVSA